MKTYSDLDHESKSEAIEAALVKLLERINEDRVTFPGQPALTLKIKEAAARAEKLKAPWFFGAIVYETCKPELTEIAAKDARRAYYREPGDLVLMLGQSI